MPVLQDGLPGFTGSLKNLTFYREKSTGRILVRTKGGVSKKRIKYAPEFERTRNLAVAPGLWPPSGMR